MTDEKFEDWSPASVFGATAGELVRQARRRPSALARSGSQGSLPVTGNTSTDQHAPTRSGRRHSRRLSSSSSNSSRYPMDTSQLAVSMQAEERSRAARVLQKYARLLLLVKREQEAVEEVNALRVMLKQAAVSQLACCYQRYRSRKAIEVYLHSWREQEARIRTLLRHAQVKKHAQEARVAALKAQRYPEQRPKASLLIAQWCAVRIRIRQQRHATRRLQIAEAPRRIVCWYRRRKLELRCRERAQKAQQSRAALRIQQAYRKIRRRRAHQLAGRYAASRAIAKCIRRYLAYKETQYARRIQVFYRQVKRMRAARQELELRRRIHRGAHLISAVFKKRGVKVAHSTWLAVCKLLQKQARERCGTSARRLQRVFRAFAARKRRVQRHESATRIQRLVRGHQARLKCLALRRQQRKLARKKRKQDAARKIQAHFRGFLARQRFTKLLKKLRDRFRCSNCGVIEPSGVYCKLCGRKRTNFDLSSTDKRLLLLSLGAPSSYMRPENSSGKGSSWPGGVSLPLHLAPVRPVSPPSFPLLQASKNTKLRTQMARRAPITTITSSNQQESESVSILAVSGLSSLPMVLSPRHAALVHTTPTKRPAFNKPPPALLFVKTPEANQSGEQFAFPSRPQPKSVHHQTKLRAQALVHIQSQQQELSQTHALTQHLHRLQKASHAVSRSR